MKTQTTEENSSKKAVFHTFSTGAQSRKSTALVNCSRGCPLVQNHECSPLPFNMATRSLGLSSVELVSVDPYAEPRFIY